MGYYLHYKDNCKSDIQIQASIDRNFSGMYKINDGSVASSIFGSKYKTTGTTQNAAQVFAV